ASIPDAEGPRAEIASLREDLGERRSHQVECQSRHDTLERAAEERIQRLGAIDSETESWVARRQIAQTQLQQLEERRESLEQELERLAARPAEIQEQRQSLMTSLERAEENRKTLADTLAQSEHALTEAERSLREAESQLAAARENMVRLQGLTEQAKQSCLALAERIKDRLECRPDQLFEISELKPEAELPELDAIDRKVERLNRERETMGPVNLRAEAEAQEMGEQIDTLGSEREDLLKAIDKLRRGISELNREGRQRLLTSFEEVNKHFQEFFTQLFGGGRAHLELTESDDPLDAGLEIMASPPGKRLQVLSLLSGGEQALTALALLFAVFQTNPAPICVLDEVDAPLDDANVDRFCSMVEKMASTDATRFLIITHHRMTMARMDRLFGVTMTERGISQLVSVDLHRADELRATA
ncbi:MAG: chromosome partitioning protein ParA, partial [Alphaproteobacteria bacterium]|nr:chromosome partitioning protein ParA [Alphaproteobacteria bacterium]